MFFCESPEEAVEVFRLLGKKKEEGKKEKKPTERAPRGSVSQKVYNYVASRKTPVSSPTVAEVLNIKANLSAATLYTLMKKGLLARTKRPFYISNRLRNRWIYWIAKKQEDRAADETEES